MGSSAERLENIVASFDGIASRRQLHEAGIDIAHIYESLREGNLTKEAHGFFSLTKNPPDEFRLLQCRSEKIVFSYATALYLQGMSDRVPHVMDITVPQGDNVTRIKRDFPDLKVHYCKKELWELGIIRVVTPQGFNVKVYDKERCVCDLIWSKDSVDMQVYTQVLREYFSKNCNPRKIIKYARKLNVEEKVRLSILGNS